MLVTGKLLHMTLALAEVLVCERLFMAVSLHDRPQELNSHERTIRTKHSLPEDANIDCKKLVGMLMRSPS